MTDSNVTHSKRIPLPEHKQCVAHKVGKPDERCQAPAIKGGAVCIWHGGSAPQIRAAANRRLFEAADPALAKLVALALRDDDKTVATQYAAVKDILDRIGLSAVQKVEISEQPSVEDFEALMDEYLKGYQAGKDAAKAAEAS